jgi:HEPN domain-containing protein
LPEAEKNNLESPIGIFNVADSYYAAAELLAKTKIRTTHSSFPTHFLFNQALELYLKAFLRLHGGKSRGHEFGPLVKRAEKKGLPFDMFDKQTLELLDVNDVAHKSRYLRIGYYENHPTTELLQTACENIRKHVSNALKESGQPLRPNPKTYALPK